MDTTESIMGYLTVRDAAARLGVGSHRIYALIEQGEIDAVRMSERATLVDALSLSRYEALGAKAGRPFSGKMALGVLWLLSGLEPNWLDYHQMRRCREALVGLTPSVLRRKCRKRAITVRCRIDASFADEALAHMRRAGVSAVDAYGFDLAGGEEACEGYVDSEALEWIRRECFARDDSRGNFVLHVVDQRFVQEMLPMPEAVVALDLAESLDSRARSAGCERLARLIGGRKNDTHR